LVGVARQTAQGRKLMVHAPSRKTDRHDQGGSHRPERFVKVGRLLLCQFELTRRRDAGQGFGRYGIKVADQRRDLYPLGNGQIGPAVDRYAHRRKLQRVVQVIRTHLPAPNDRYRAVACNNRCFHGDLPQIGNNAAILTLNDTLQGTDSSRIGLEPYGKQ
tara:strand:- start:285 stop:764 length:480 start_codon:yes stop_codon:yes gene_type:complete